MTLRGIETLLDLTATYEVWYKHYSQDPRLYERVAYLQEGLIGPLEAVDRVWGLVPRVRHVIE